ncbi:uncharacterized protein LOC127879041 [Dreissena polymorpha]|uniref:TNFR-Cys domain-containing protein n=1 Tax=Dreissena polymorpha TaxID=45954 RepID=A0A9D4JZM1_DREPO|nr:uncharacterized protein LOC127879041 [Dreissena polymorpha]KAH3830690.1 hypothetical protein DPMN_103936 [Dreissena polymorpha]
MTFQEKCNNGGCGVMDLITTNVFCMIVTLIQMWTDKVHSLMPHYRIMGQCPVQSYYDITVSENDKCSPCSICSDGFQIKENCTATRDTVCKPCEQGTFNDVIGGECRKCRVCIPGQYTQRHCRAHKDAKCRSCPMFTFSSRPNVGVCRYCKTCYEHQTEVLTCRRNRDRKCGRCMTGFFRRSDGGGCLQCHPEVHVPNFKACLHNKALDLDKTYPQTEVAELHVHRKEGNQVYGSFITTTILTTTVEDLPDDISWRIAAATGSFVASFILLLIGLCFFFKMIKIDFLSSPPYVVRM